MLKLPDGGRVESSLLVAHDETSDRPVRAYRLRRPDGSVTEFSTLGSILKHLVDQYGPDRLR